MRFKNILIGVFLIVTVVIVAGCNTTPNEQSITTSANQDINIEELKNTSIEMIKQYYNIEPDLDGFSFTANNETAEDMKNSLDNVINGLKNNESEYVGLSDEQKQDRIKELEEAKNTIKNGKIYMCWITSNQNADESPKEYGFYQVVLNDKTKEVISIECIISQDLENIKPENFVSIEQSEKIAVEFIEQNNLVDLKNMKLANKAEMKNHVNAAYDVSDSVEFFYEDINDSNNVLYITVDRILGKVNSFYIGAE